MSNINRRELPSDVQKKFTNGQNHEIYKIVQVRNFIYILQP